MIQLGRRTPPVCINIVSELSHLELLQYDPKKGNFIALDSDEFMFDPASREMLEDEERLKIVLKRLYERNKIPLNTPTTLVLPSYFTRQYTLPDDAVIDDLSSILVSEAERFYVFKKVDPAVGYCQTLENQVLYTAYPKNCLEALKVAFEELKIPLVSIDCNYTAVIRGLVAMGVVQQELANMVKWGMVMMTDQMVFMAILEGPVIEKIVESPLSSQGVDPNSLMGEVRDDFQQFCGFEILNRLVVVNNSARIYSTQLVDMLGFQGPTDVFDQNERTLISRKAEDAPFPCSLECVGGVLVRTVPEVPPMEMGEGKIADVGGDDQLINVVAAGLIGIGVLIYGVQFGIAKMFDSFQQSEVKNNEKIQREIDAAINSLSVVPDVKKKMFIRQGQFQNYRYSNLLINLHKEIPEDTELKKLEVKSTEKMDSVNITISGRTGTSDSLNQYVQNMNQHLENDKFLPDITPSTYDGQRIFDFTLVNEKSQKKAETGKRGRRRGR